MEKTDQLLAGEARQERILTSADVLDYYKGVDASLRQDVEKMIALYPHWERRKLTPRDIGDMNWYKDDNPGHISRELTQGGRRVAEVAREFLTRRDYYLTNWDRAGKILAMVDKLKNGGNLSPIIVVPGDRYPKSPESSFIDGVHRSLAFMLYALETGDGDVTLDAFVGKKASLIERVVGKVLNLGG